jgi:hypothetical protein
VSKAKQDQIIKILDKMVQLYDERELAESLGGEAFKDWDLLNKMLIISFNRYDRHKGLIEELQYNNKLDGLHIKIGILEHRISVSLRVSRADMHESCTLSHDFNSVMFFKYSLDKVWRKVMEVSLYFKDKEKKRKSKIMQEEDLLKIEIVDKILDIAFTDVDKILLGEEDT